MMKSEVLRSMRRHHRERMKAKWKSSQSKAGIQAIEPATANDPKQVGRFVHTRKLCSCWMCGNPRKFSGQRSIQERRMMQEPGEEATIVFGPE